jgi:hypothetical protein
MSVGLPWGQEDGVPSISLTATSDCLKLSPTINVLNAKLAIFFSFHPVGTAVSDQSFRSLGLNITLLGRVVLFSTPVNPSLSAQTMLADITGQFFIDADSTRSLLILNADLSNQWTPFPMYVFFF